MTRPSFIDSHCHLNDSTLHDSLAAVVASSCQAGVTGWIVPGVAPGSWPEIASLARTVIGVMPAFGVHPQWADCWNQSTADLLGQLAAESVAIGEIGLDYSATMPLRELQQQVFRAQLRIARAAHRPVLIHCRRAFADFLAIAGSEGIGEVGGVMHAFSGSLEIARECIRMGMLIGVAGPVTYASAKRLPEIVAALGLRHLVLETDAPDLAPVPHRGEGNVPANLPLIARKVAELCGTTVEEVAVTTSANIMGLLQSSVDLGRRFS